MELKHPLNDEMERLLNSVDNYIDYELARMTRLSNTKSDRIKELEGMLSILKEEIRLVERNQEYWYRRAMVNEEADRGTAPSGEADSVGAHGEKTVF